MAACPTQTFPDFPQDRFDRLVQAAAAIGIVISGPEGVTSFSGVTVRWKFDAATESLELQCVDAPVFPPCGLIDFKLQEMVGRCR